MTQESTQLKFQGIDNGTRRFSGFLPALKDGVSTGGSDDRSASEPG